MRRSLMCMAGMKPHHEWQWHEPLLVNYEGWRILDHPKYDKPSDFWVFDLMGCVRHVDPIIDDPRLTHQQRVCRLYRWALKEMQSYLTAYNAYKMNLGAKVIRARFERYRYVTDPAMCDMMIRESHKYLADNANVHFMRKYPSNPRVNGSLMNPMFHPDNSFCYDHWVQPEVMWYDDAKLHRFTGHNPAHAGAGYHSERYGDFEVAPWTVLPTYVFFGVLFAYLLIYNAGGFMDNNLTADDPHFAKWNAQWDHNLQGAIFYEERCRRSANESSAIGWDWDKILGIKKARDIGLQGYFGKVPESEKVHAN